jgi:hypothetical protein
MPSLEARLARLEKTLAIEDAPKTYSYAQIVALSNGVAAVGDPDTPIVAGEPTPADLILEAAGEETQPARAAGVSGVEITNGRVRTRIPVGARVPEGWTEVQTE